MLLQLTCWPGQYCYCVYTSLSGFLVVFPYLVLMTSLPSETDLVSVGTLVFSFFFHGLPFHCFAPCLLPLLFDCSLFAYETVHHGLLFLFVHASIYAIKFLLILFNMSASGSVLAYGSFVVWYCRYVSAMIDVGLMCCLLHMIHLPLVVSCMVYALL